MNPIRKLFIFSITMIIVPITGYFVSKQYFDHYTTNHWANIYAAIVAVLIVHCILFTFVYQAYHEDRVAQRAELEEKKTD